MLSLKLEADHYVPAENSITAAYGDLILDQEPSYGFTLAFSPYSTADNLEMLVAENISINDDRLYFSIEQENIAAIAIESNIYTQGVGAELAQGEFKYLNGVVEIRTYQAVSPESIITYLAQKNTLLHKSTKICPLPIDPVLSKWGAIETFSISRSFGQEPSASFSFQSCLSDEGYINLALCNGTKLIIEGISWVVMGLGITNLKNTGIIVVTVSLGHCLAARGNPSKSPQDQKILKKKSLSKTSYVRSRKLSEYASQSGVKFSGGNDRVRTSRNTGVEETTTLRQLLGARAIKNHSFVFYNSDGVELRNWYNTRIHVISECDIRGEFGYSNAGHGSVVDGVKLHTEFRNLKVNLDFDQDVSDRNVGITIRWVFEGCRDLEDLYSPREDKGFYFTEPDPETLRNVGLNFDSGGRTKKATQIISYNGTPTFETKYKAGYAYSSAEIYDIHITEQRNFILKLKTLINPQTHWKKLSIITTNHIFDDDGYAESKRTTGWELTRLQQESHQLEAITMQAKAIQNSTNLVPDPSLSAQAEAYKFNQSLPIEDITNYTLEPHSKYFSETIKFANPCHKDTEVESKFVSQMHRFSQSQILAPNPKSTPEFTYPLIVTGKHLFELEQTSITLSTFPFQFEQYKSSTAAEGEYLKNAIALGTVTQNDGKPGIAPKLNRQLDLEDTSSNNNYDRYSDSNYYLSSVGVDGQQPLNEGSKGYPDVDDPFQVAAIAQTELSIINSRSSRTATVDIYWRRGIHEGDFVLIRGELWKIFAISDNRKIGHQGFTSTSLNLTLGRFLVSDIKLENRKNC